MEFFTPDFTPEDAAVLKKECIPALVTLVSFLICAQRMHFLINGQMRLELWEYLLPAKLQDLQRFSMIIRQFSCEDPAILAQIRDGLQVLFRAGGRDIPIEHIMEVVNNLPLNMISQYVRDHNKAKTRGYLDLIPSPTRENFTDKMDLLRSKVAISSSLAAQNLAHMSYLVERPDDVEVLFHHSEVVPSTFFLSFHYRTHSSREGMKEFIELMNEHKMFVYKFFDVAPYVDFTALCAVLKILRDADCLRFFHVNMTVEQATNVAMNSTGIQMDSSLAMENLNSDLPTVEFLARIPEWFLIPATKLRVAMDDDSLFLYKQLYNRLEELGFLEWYTHLLTVINHANERLDHAELFQCIEILTKDLVHGELLRFIDEVVESKGFIDPADAHELRISYDFLCKHGIQFEMHGQITLNKARMAVEILNFLDENDYLNLFSCACNLDHAREMVEVLRALKASSMESRWTGPQMTLADVKALRRKQMEIKQMDEVARSLWELGGAMILANKLDSNESLLLIEVNKYFRNTGLASYFYYNKWYEEIHKNGNYALEHAYQYVEVLKVFVNTGLSFSQGYSSWDLSRMIADEKKRLLDEKRARCPVVSHGRLCMFHATGICRPPGGRQCRFSHAYCWEYARTGHCLSDACPWPHVPRNMIAICNQFAKYGVCTFGDRCRFKH